MNNIYATLSMAGAIQAFLLAIVLVIKRSNRRANIFLSLCLFFAALDLLEFYLSTRGVLDMLPPWQLSQVPYSLVFGPSVFFYIARLTGKIQTLSMRHYLLYFPFLAAFSVFLFFNSFYTGLQMPWFVPYINMLIYGGGLLFEGVLYVVSIVMLQRYIKLLKDYFSAFDSLRLSSIRGIIVMLPVAVVLIFLSYIHKGHVRHEQGLIDLIVVGSWLLILFAVAFLALLLPDIFSRVKLLETAVPAGEKKDVPRYEKLRLSDSEEQEIAARVEEYMREERPYLDESLTLQDLAEDLSLATHHLSMILNIHFEQNFYNFINMFRVDAASEKIKDPAFRDETLLSIAFSSGFNSKSTFNAMFKKFTGKTPKQYRDEYSS